jgi:signal transduction histidine kinase
MNVAQWLDVPSTDPDDARRRKLLNILLAAMAPLSILVVLATTFGQRAGLALERQIILYLGSFAMLLVVGIVLAVNRYWSGDVASSFFLLSITIISAFIDEPQQVVGGRTLFVFTIPILMASFLLRPWVSFVMTGLISLLLTAVAQSAQLAPNLIGMLTLFAIALVSWLAARTMERALEDLRIINRELDQRVEERTRDLAEANEQLAVANEQLKELDRLKSGFVSIVSHELRTPLNSVLGFAEMLEASIYGPLTEKQLDAIGRIITNTEQLLHLVNELLDQARIEAGVLTLEKEPFSPTELIQDLQSTVGLQVEAKELELICNIAADVPTNLSGDPGRLQQILVNLVNNAVKFTEKGTIDVCIYRPDTAHWALSVSDTGPGIPPEKQALVFEPFLQLDGSTTRKHGGIGLGLSIVKQLTHLMGGEINLESQVERGSTFIVVLPLEPV